MKLSVVLSTQPARFAAATFKGDLVAGLAQIASLGYQGVELAIRDPELMDCEMLMSLLSKHGLMVPAIGTGQAWGEDGLSFTDPDAVIRRRAIERIKSHMPLAARLGAMLIIGLIRGTTQSGIELKQSMDWLLDALDECSSAAQARGVRLALEPINRYETSLINNVQQGLELVERLDTDNLGLLLDTFHMNMEEASIEASIAACARHIFHFHVADSNRWHPGAGHLDFRSILAALDKAGYTGWISGEFLPEPNALSAARNGIDYLTELLAHPN